MSTETFPARLVCPRCRVPGPDGRLVVSLLEVDGSSGAPRDLCPRCGTAYPRVDGVRCVPPDLPAFLAAQAAALPPAGPTFAAEEGEALCCRLEALDPADDSFREALFAGQHALAHVPGSAGALAEELLGNAGLFATAKEWIEKHARPASAPAGCLLEAGCGPGGLLAAVAPLFPAGALGLDLRVGVLRLARRLADRGEAVVPFRVEGSRFAPVSLVVPAEARARAGTVHLLQGDLLSPPLEAEAFPAVVAISLLDAVADPIAALGQLDALLAPGGLLLVGAPWSWDARVTPPGAWWSRPGATAGALLRAALAGRHPALPHLSYALLEEVERVAWAIPGHARLVHRYVLELLLARKSG